MKRFIIIAAIAALAVMTASCNKFELENEMPTPEEPALSLYNIDLRFDAVAPEAVVEFYDADGYLVSENNLAIPATSAEVVAVTIPSMTRPAFLYTEGLTNGEDGGLLRIPASSLDTKADNSILLIIR